MSLQEYGNRYRHARIQLLKELPGEGVFAENEFNDIFYFSLPMWQQNMRILSNYDYESFSFARNLPYYVSSEAASELLLKAKGLFNRKEWKQTPHGKTQAKKSSKGKYKKVCKRGNKVKDTCFNCGKPGHYKSNCSELKKGRNGEEEVCLINCVKWTESFKVVSGALMPIPIIKDPQRTLLKEQNEAMFSMQERGDFEQMLADLQVKEASQHSLFPLISTCKKVTNNTSKLDLCAEICMALF